MELLKIPFVIDRNEIYRTILGFTPVIVVKGWLTHPLTDAPKSESALFGPEKNVSSK
jgi:hypothetical protein